MPKTAATTPPRHPASSNGPIEAIRSAAALGRWHVPALAGSESSLPYIALEGDEPVALLFTTRRKSNRAINGWIGEVADVSIQSVPLDRSAALKMLERLHSRGLQWVRIDHGPQSIRLPIEPLIGAMQQAWEQRASLDPAQSAWAWLARQDEVLMLRDPSATSLPFVEILNEAPSIRLFVSRRRAMARAVRLSLHGDTQPDQTMSLTGASTIECLRRLAHLGVDQVIIEQPGGIKRLSLSALLDHARRAA